MRSRWIVAASVDTDRDGYPDAWNAGMSQSDSTTGLTLDAFPQDSACWLAAHGSGGVCNYGATIPNYMPDQVVQHGDVVYLLSTANRRVYRWSISAGAYLNPYIVGINQGFNTVAPTKMEYSAAHQRLYLGYAAGAIRYIDVNAGNPPRRHSSPGVGHHSPDERQQFPGGAGQGDYSSYGSHVINSAGVTTGHGRVRTITPPTTTTWDPVTSRLYYVSSGYHSDV